MVFYASSILIKAGYEARLVEGVTAVAAPVQLTLAFE